LYQLPKEMQYLLWKIFGGWKMNLQEKMAKMENFSACAGWANRLNTSEQRSHEISCDINNIKSHENLMRTHERMPAEEYKALVKKLDNWNVKYRHYILKHYPASSVREAIARTEHNKDKARHLGAYFCKVIRSL
jgi:hypothetical protein